MNLFHKRITYYQFMLILVPRSVNKIYMLFLVLFKRFKKNYEFAGFG